MISITTSNMNGIRAAKRKGVEEWARRNAPDVWCMQEVRAPQTELDPILDGLAVDYAEAGRIEGPAALHRVNEVCRVSRAAPASPCSPTLR